MGLSFRKSFRLLPGVRVSLSKSGPRLSVGIPGARVNMDAQGKARIYGSAGPLRFQKQVSMRADHSANESSPGLLATLSRFFQGR
jgi:hypothetical protein